MGERNSKSGYMGLKRDRERNSVRERERVGEREKEGERTDG